MRCLDGSYHSYLRDHGKCFLKFNDFEQKNTKDLKQLMKQNLNKINMMTVIAVAKLSQSTTVINAKNVALQVTGQTVTHGLTLLWRLRL